MLRFDWNPSALLAALVLIVGSETLTAGGWNLRKPQAPSATEARGIVVRGQEPSPAPPTAEVAPDPGYSPPADSAPPQPAAPPVDAMPPAATDLAPLYSGFSIGEHGPMCMGHTCPKRRETNRWLNWCGFNMAKTSARMHGDSHYEDCYPLFGPRYGYYETCWRRLPEDCRCPIYIPPRKSQLTPVPEESKPAGEVIPPPPQVLNFR